MRGGIGRELGREQLQKEIAEKGEANTVRTEGMSCRRVRWDRRDAGLPAIAINSENVRKESEIREGQLEGQKETLKKENGTT